MKFVYHYMIALMVFLVIDMVWLVVIAKDLYQKELGFIMAKTPNLGAAIIFYLIFIGGLVYFVIMPGVQTGSWSSVLFRGLFFGLVTYATYDLTNLATLENWPIKITIIDLIWGSVLCGSVSVVTFWISHLWIKG